MIIIRIDNRKCVIWIVFSKSIGQPCLAFRIPLKFVGMQNAVNILDIINFLLLLRAPKITFAIKLVIGIMFNALADYIVFP